MTAKYELEHNTKPLVAVDFASIGSDTTTVGNSVDTKGFEGLLFALMTGAWTDGTFTLLIEDADDDGTGSPAAFSPVDDKWLVPSDLEEPTGAEAVKALAAANSVSHLSYVGKKRHVRASIVSTGVTTGADAGALALQSHPLEAPTDA